MLIWTSEDKKVYIYVYMYVGSQGPRSDFGHALIPLLLPTLLYYYPTTNTLLIYL